jgi:hypothetical protein
MINGKHNPLNNPTEFVDISSNMCFTDRATADKIKQSFNPPTCKASAVGRRSQPTADKDGGREGKVNS